MRACKRTSKIGTSSTGWKGRIQLRVTHAAADRPCVNVSTAARGEPEKTAETFAVKVWVASASEVERERATTGAANLRRIDDDYVHNYNEEQNNF